MSVLYRCVVCKNTICYELKKKKNVSVYMTSTADRQWGTISTENGTFSKLVYCNKLPSWDSCLYFLFLLHHGTSFADLCFIIYEKYSLPLPENLCSSNSSQTKTSNCCVDVVAAVQAPPTTRLPSFYQQLSKKKQLNWKS
jgi:hypothetical protein